MKKKKKKKNGNKTRKITNTEQADAIKPARKKKKSVL